MDCTSVRVPDAVTADWYDERYLGCPARPRSPMSEDSGGPVTTLDWWSPPAVGGFIGLGLVGWACVQWATPSIEADLSERAQIALRDGGFAPSIEVQLDGRDATLRGSAPSALEERRAKDTLEQVWGIRRVTSALVRKDRRVLLGATVSRPAPQGGAAPVPAPPPPQAHPALETPEATALTDEIKAVLEENTIEFKFGEAALSARGESTVKAVATVLQTSPRLVVEIGGHTDTTGTEAYNLDLSRRRAQTVADALQAQGIDAVRLVPVGFGSSQPRASNRSESSRAHNRRIEFRVIRETEP